MAVVAGVGRAILAVLPGPGRGRDAAHVVRPHRAQGSAAMVVDVLGHVAVVAEAAGFAFGMVRVRRHIGAHALVAAQAVVVAHRARLEQAGSRRPLVVVGVVAVVAARLALLVAL